MNEPDLAPPVTSAAEQLLERLASIVAQARADGDIPPGALVSISVVRGRAYARMILPDSAAPAPTPRPRPLD